MYVTTQQRNPIKDKVAIVGVGSTGFSREEFKKSRNHLAVEASVAAIKDAGLTAADIDGVVATGNSPTWMASALGLPAVTHHSNQPPPLVFGIVDAMNAIFSGAANAVLVFHSVYRTPANSRSAYADPYRRKLGYGGMDPSLPQRFDPENIYGGPGYAAWASDYAHRYGFDKMREGLSRIAVNSRRGAEDNPLAAIREPMTLADYQQARMVREPLGLFDMDMPVDGGDAFVLTTAEQAADLPHKPALIHATAAGLIAECEEDQTPGLHHHGQHVVLESLKAKSDLWLDDADVYFPYDGFTFITLSWLENSGWCEPGEGADFLKQHWDAEQNRILINGKLPVNPHGGALSEGGTQGSGHIREATLQLRGDAGIRQVEGAKTAFLTPGGLFFNAQGLVLRAD